MTLPPCLPDALSASMICRMKLETLVSGVLPLVAVPLAGGFVLVTELIRGLDKVLLCGCNIVMARFCIKLSAGDCPFNKSQCHRKVREAKNLLSVSLKVAHNGCG